MKKRNMMLISVVVLVLLLAAAALPLRPAAGQDGEDGPDPVRCASLRRAISCGCMGIDTPTTFIYMRGLTPEELALYMAIYETLGCAALEATEEPEPTATPKPKRAAARRSEPGVAGVTPTPRDPACRQTVIPDDAVHIELVEDTRLLWAPDADAQTEYTVPAGTTAWQIALDESGKYAALAWTCSVVIYVPVDHTAPVLEG